MSAGGFGFFVVVLLLLWAPDGVSNQLLYTDSEEPIHSLSMILAISEFRICLNVCGRLGMYLLVYVVYILFSSKVMNRLYDI